MSRETQAVVLSVDGTASVMRARNDQTEPLVIHSSLRAGDVVRTSAEGQVSLQLVPGILSAIKSDSEWTIEEARVAKDGNAMTNAMLQRRARLRFARGVMDAVVEKKDAAGATLMVETPLGTIDAQGESVFRLIVSDKDGRVLCVRGSLLIESKGGGSTSLEAGSYRELAADSKVTKRADERCSDHRHYRSGRIVSDRAALGKGVRRSWCGAADE